MKSIDVDLNKLETFFAIADAGGVSAAARRLALSRSAVSHSLASLEASLGLFLFHRVGKKLLLTPEGARMQRAFGSARQQIAAALEQLTSNDDDVRGLVRVGLFLGFSRFRLTRVIDRFLQDHPAARLRIVYGSQADLVEQLLEAKLDFALSLESSPRASRNVTSTRLFEQTLVLAVGRRLRPSRTGFQELAKLPVVDYYRSDPLIDRWMRHHFAGRRIPRRNVRVWAASTEVVLELVLHHVGIGVLPHDVVEPFRKRNELFVVRGRSSPLRDFVWLNELRGIHPSRAHSAFRAVLLRVVSSSLPGPGRAGGKRP